ncbi:MAG: ferrous iron transport protein B [Eubacterium sp.]|nr:ferrous iron transport protein B [Eubacterium sp.]MCH4046228.1 ferrous iron transport protein B [Eubacterium sp.]MCH4079323.1 ferrous iron transport protein B [Eubacterium sp.]MCH4110547.1 ferrous iron transport protein B [Eubacterium sp.]MCI1307711.1 ferrous iron transport protein B [Eubacterium sp.]
MEIKIALAGNPNCGKTTLFNDLTGSTQYVGNWPGVTVEKKEGRLKGHKDVIIQDLPGIYSLSPYTMEEVVSRNYLVNEKPDAIINIIDGTNVERNLYLTTQVLDLNIPTVIAVNMYDLVRKNGDRLDLHKLAKELGCPVIPISALKGEGGAELVDKAIEIAQKHQRAEAPHVFEGSVEHAIAHIEESISPFVDKNNLRWYAIKLFERDEKVIEELKLDEALMKHLDMHIQDCEKEMDDDAESIITNQRYTYIQKVVDDAVHQKRARGNMTLSDRIDRVVTNKWLALPIFACVMFLMYYISISTLGGWLTDWTNDTLFGTWITNAANAGLKAIGSPAWLQSLLVDGIIGGVGTVLGFVPQMVLIFIFMAILEDSGYMARVAFIMDRLFRRFGLSGKSFVPILIGTGCGVPAIMATRTIENERDRRMTIMLCTYLPCGAKLTIIGVIVSTFFPGSKFIAPAMYFLGIAVIVLAGIALKKVGYFAGDPAPFVMELPAYHLPTVKGVAIHTWDRAKHFIMKAGTIIFSITVILWFLESFNFQLQMVDMNHSMLAAIGHALHWIFIPLGFGSWKGTVAAISAFAAKEQATSTLALLGGFNEASRAGMHAIFAGPGVPSATLAAFSFLMFNLFDPPCLVAMVTAFKEQGQQRWGWYTVGFQFLVGFMMSFITYQMGAWLIYGVSFGVGQAVALVVIAFIVYCVVRRPSKGKSEDLPEGEPAVK